MIILNIFTKKPFLIADIGSNFINTAQENDISNMAAAKFAIDQAKSCGFDAVNFEAYDLKNLFSRDYVEYLSKEPITSHFFKFDGFGYEEFRELADYCHEVKISFLATPMDFESADYLEELVDVYKISSHDLTNIPFIKHVASKNKPMLLNTGGATLKEIKDAVRSIEENSLVDIAIIHSVLSYPTSYEDASLLMIKDLANNFPDYEIGYCDYTEVDDDLLVLTTAYNYGAVALEKQFTCNKAPSDNTCAITYEGVIKLKSKLAFLSKINGRINKQPLICESFARNETRKSIVAKTDIKKGELISEDKITFKMPSIGISPAQVDDVIGKKAKVDIFKDNLIDFEMFD
ncbi:N-acetylneuraminate synthase family protein [uncultured Methanobrevibacter sp.]|uniref:N-acetylneuraminate synthase family protein n=1 Tax=uncultured Methanobrevibacter sp. TaxID=253161 RepID=UPI00262F568E|nr:N-acetylneuraminate synthase family protein [uncultured Methanobrevibacter sp.]